MAKIARREIESKQMTKYCDLHPGVILRLDGITGRAQCFKCQQANAAAARRNPLVLQAKSNKSGVVFDV